MRADSKKRSSAFRRVRAIVGLTTLGEGLFIAARVVPHEPLLLGAGLLLLGAALLWRSELPRVTKLPAKMIIVTAAAGAAMGVLAYDALQNAALDAPKVVIVILGFATAALAQVDTRRIGNIPIASVIAWSIPTAWAPLGVWALQGALKTSWGQTPIETFTSVGLLVPLAGVLSLLGRAPVVHDSVITYATPHGPLSLEVGVACSGIQAMALFAAILGVLLLVERPPLKRAGTWVMLGMGGVYLVNILRLVTLSLVGSQWGSGALEEVHANAGWIFFIAWSAIFALIVTRCSTPRAHAL